MSKGFLCELRRVVWPIEVSEYKKFLPMAAMMFFMLFNYSLFRSIKDAFVVSEIGAESISFLKTYFVFPSAIIAMILYVKLCNMVDTKKVFYVVTTIFIVYIALFTFVFYPHPDLVHPNPQTTENLSQMFPNFKWFIKIIGKWSFASFYIMAELWGSMIITLLFWQFANQITKTEEARRFYSTFGLVGNFGLICTDLVVGHFLGEGKSISGDLSFIPVLSSGIISGILILLIYRWINANVLTDTRFYTPVEKKDKKSKVKLSMRDSFKLIFSSKYLAFIAILVLAYGVSINLVEGVWKAKLKELYPTKEAYMVFMGKFQGWQGKAAIVVMILGSNILRKLSWTTSAMFTPVMILVTGLGFFGFVFFQDSLGALTAFFVVQPLVLAVTFGTIQNILSKAVKYSLFDSTKEMAYIPLDDDLKSKGKAAVDVVGGRMGKSGGGLIQSTFFIIFPTFTFTEAAPYFAGMFFIVVIAWLFAVSSLSKQYQEAVGHSSKPVSQAA